MAAEAQASGPPARHARPAGTRPAQHTVTALSRALPHPTPALSLRAIRRFRPHEGNASLTLAIPYPPSTRWTEPTSRHAR
jgi:hypothetical protein